MEGEWFLKIDWGKLFKRSIASRSEFFTAMCVSYGLRLKTFPRERLGEMIKKGSSEGAKVNGCFWIALFSPDLELRHRVLKSISSWQLVKSLELARPPQNSRQNKSREKRCQLSHIISRKERRRREKKVSSSGLREQEENVSSIDASWVSNYFPALWYDLVLLTRAWWTFRLQAAPKSRDSAKVHENSKVAALANTFVYHTEIERNAHALCYNSIGLFQLSLNSDDVSLPYALMRRPENF